MLGIRHRKKDCCHRADWSGGTTWDFYPGKVRFDSRLGNRLPYLTFHGFRQLLQAKTGIVSRLGCYRSSFTDHRIILLMSLNSLVLWLKACRVRVDPPPLRTEDVIMCCVFRYIAHVKSVVEWRLERETRLNFPTMLSSGRSIAKAVSRWFSNAAARVHARVWSSGICGGQIGAVGRFSPSTSVSSANLHSTKFSILTITRGRYNRSEMADVSSGPS
jgi:hypothetical protein